ncbi:hypothetical protein GCM10011380_31560 [Sphingomonas metalli]|uniref:Uncharacterized protein n=1 Tax=Sphingomonas metalli TaxID=1779358 RepID=A0A916TC20_9SPHN|nr:hypothetical protein GCM10011380_31560 [Sphingomonas metalli]
MSPASTVWPFTQRGAELAAGAAGATVSGRQPSGLRGCDERGQSQGEPSTSPSQKVSLGGRSVRQLGQNLIKKALPPCRT